MADRTVQAPLARTSPAVPSLGSVYLAVVSSLLLFAVEYLLDRSLRVAVLISGSVC